MKYVEFLSSEITKIPNTIFKKFPNLQKIMLPTILLKNLNRTSLRGATKLKQIWAKGNYLEQLESDSFNEAVQLTLIDFQDNWISNVDKGAFRGLSKLEELRLGGNFIGSLDKNTFSDLTNLIKIDLSSNMIYNLKDGLFNKNKKLEEVHLCCNKISVISSNLFSETKLLSFLNLAHNTCISRTFGPKNRALSSLQKEIQNCSTDGSPDAQMKRLKKELQDMKKHMSTLESKKSIMDSQMINQAEENVQLKKNNTRIMKELIGARKNITLMQEAIVQYNKDIDAFNQTSVEMEDLKSSLERAETEIAAIRYAKNQGDAVYQQCEVNKSECQENALKISTMWQQSQSSATELLLDNDKLNDKLRLCQEAKIMCQNQKNIIRTG